MIKNNTSELRGYEESKITALAHTHAHIAGKRSHTILNSIFNSLITLKSTKYITKGPILTIG